MDARFWTVVILIVWIVVLANALISLLPLRRAAWARVWYWRIWRIILPVAFVLLATILTLNILARERYWIFAFSSDVFMIVQFALIGLAVLGFVGASFLLMAGIPGAGSVLHVPPRLYAWLYERDINESSQPASSPQSLPGDDR